MLLRRQCLRAECSSPPLWKEKVLAVSACNPVQPHLSRDTRVEWRPTSAFSWGQILDLLCNLPRSWTAFICLFLITGNALTRGRDTSSRKSWHAPNKVFRWQNCRQPTKYRNWVTSTLAHHSFCKTGFSRCACVKAERSRELSVPHSFFLKSM